MVLEWIVWLYLAVLTHSSHKFQQYDRAFSKAALYDVLQKHKIVSANFSIRRGYWVFGLCPSFGILKKTSFRKLDLCPTWGERVGGTYSFGSVRKSWPQLLELPSISFITELTESVSLACHLKDGKRPSFRNVMFLEYRTLNKSKNPVIPSLIHHRRNSKVRPARRADNLAAIY
jgi:hypothetical protein